MKISISTRGLLVSAVLLIVTGCDNSRPIYEYEYDSVYSKDVPVKDSNIAKAPITFTLRFEKKADSLFIRSKMVDAEGRIEFGTETLPCSVFDQRNFTCERSDGRETLTMKDGQLTTSNDGERLTWRRHVCILGHRVT
jgi:hypothetical protein